MDIKIEQIVSEAVMEAIREVEDDMSPPVMATGAVLIVDVLHDDGLHYLHTFRPEDTPAWVAVGMAEFGKSHWLASSKDDD